MVNLPLTLDILKHLVLKKANTIWLKRKFKIKRNAPSRPPDGADLLQIFLTKITKQIIWSFQLITDHNKITNTNNSPIFNLKTEFTVLYREIKIMNFIPHRKKEEIWILTLPRKAIYFSHDTILLKQLFFRLSISQISLYLDISCTNLRRWQNKPAFFRALF